MITMPREGQHDAERASPADRLAEKQTDMSVENGTPIWLATATVAASSARKMPANSSANAAGPVSIAAANRLVICPRWILQHRHQEQRERAEAHRREEDRRKLADADLGGDQVETPDQVHPDQQREVAARPATWARPHSWMVTDMRRRSARVTVLQESVERADCLRFRADRPARPLLAVPSHTDRDAPSCALQ